MNSDVFGFSLGNFSCMAIKDAAAPYPIAMFLTNLSKERYQPEQIELPYTCLLIDTGQHKVLVDTGVGPDRLSAGQGKLLSLLQREELDPYQIDTVILSHAHPDHIGGSLNSAGKPAFRNARYVMLQREWDYWTSNPALAEMSLDDEFRRHLLESPQKILPAIQTQLELIDPETEIVPGVVAVAAFGHTPGQMGLEISSAGSRLFFVADAIVVPLHLEYPESIGATDHQPGEMVSTRLKILEKAARDQLLVSTSHFAFPGLGYVVAKGDRWEWKAGRAEVRKAGYSES